MRALAPLVLAAALMTGACTHPDGSFNAPGTIALGAGAALAAVAIASASDDRPRRSYRRDYHQPRYHGHPGYYRQPGYHGGGGYRRW